MSKVLEMAFDEVQKSRFEFRTDRRSGREFVVVEDAFIFWTNFAGKPNKYGNSARTFNLAVPENVAQELLNRGWKVRQEFVFQSDENDLTAPVIYFVNIKINMTTNNPPSISLFSEFRGKKKKQVMDVNTMEILDHVDILSCDCTINEYESKNYPGKVSGYLSDLKIIQNPSCDYNGKYDDWDTTEEEEAQDFLNGLPGGEDENY